MTTLVKVVVLLAAGLFVGISASMNAAFLSIFGRTDLETSLLVGVSFAGDAVKAVLPVVVMRALLVRAWLHAALASGMLAIVTVMSLVSGIGFAALTRGGAIAIRESEAATLVAREQELAGLDRRLATLTEGRSVARIQAAMDALKLEKGWLASQSCTQAGGPTLRQYCASVFTLRAELSTASERDGLVTERRALRRQIETLRRSGADADGDPQATALAELFGTDRKLPRLLITTGMAVVLELGSLILLLLAAGPALAGWREPGSAPVSPPVPASLPLSADRAHWQRQRNLGNLPGNRGTSDAQ